MWTTDKIDKIKKIYSDTDNDIISELLGIKKSYIIKKANDLGLKKTKEYISKIRKLNNPRTFWSDYEEKKLIELYKTHSNREISEIINKGIKSIVVKLKRLNIKRSKLEKDYITAKICKNNGRDLNYENLKEISKKYNTKTDLYLNDPSAYSRILKNGWMDEFSKDMISGGFSTPQLIMKSILEFILNDKCRYNDRTIIKPLEIDCYFDKYKIGWEYDGRRYHSSIDDKQKIDKCHQKGVRLFIIHEFTDDYRDYTKNIKNQIIKQLDQINKITNLNIKEIDISNYSPIVEYPNILLLEEKESIKGKKMSDIRTNKDLFRKIKKYNLCNELNIENDIKKKNKFENFQEYKEYIVNLNCKNFNELCKTEHPHRIMKRFGLDIKIIHDIYK